MSQQSNNYSDNNEAKENLNKMINGIIEEAQQEADRIIQEAKQQAAERSEAKEKQIQRILAEAEEKAEAQIKLIETQNSSSISVETKRIYLKVRDEIINSILLDIEKKLVEKISHKNYPEILKDLIVEAALGLNVDEAEINSSAKEKAMISQELLKQASQECEKILSKPVKLVLSSQAPLLTQGVTLTSKNRKTAFNNTFSTRLLRYQSEIRKLIYNRLFKD